MKFLTLAFAVCLVSVLADDSSEVLNRIDSSTTITAPIVMKEFRASDEDETTTGVPDESTITTTRKGRRRDSDRNCEGGCMRCRHDKGWKGFETCNRYKWVYRQCSPGTSCRSFGTCRIVCD
uniref:Uncharacterized protein n=1 Tax=Romanomermis culicivorax TaxID=13658 RepID=A0A915IFI0_ROMCU